MVALLTIPARGRGGGVVGAVVRAVRLVTEVQHYDLPGREGFSLYYIIVIVIMVIKIITTNITILIILCPEKDLHNANIKVYVNFVILIVIKSL